MIIWNNTLEQHDIHIGAGASVSKYLDGGELPNKNVKVGAAEVVVKNIVDAEITSFGYHFYIHIFTFPNKSEPDIPFEYRLWVGPISDEPVAFPGTDYWWEIPPQPEF